MAKDAFFALLRLHLVGVRSGLPPFARRNNVAALIESYATKVLRVGCQKRLFKLTAHSLADLQVSRRWILYVRWGIGQLFAHPA